MEATARIFFQKAPAKRTIENLCPVKLCITKNQERRYYSIAKKIKEGKRDWLFVSEKDIKSITCSSPRGQYRDMFYEYERIKKEAQDIINEIQPFSFNRFEEKYLNKTKSWDDIFSAMWQHIQDLKSEGRIGYASSFESTLRALKEYHTGKRFKFNSRKDKVNTREQEYLSGKKLLFVDITASWLRSFEAHLRTVKKSETTIGIHFRNLRRLFNIALEEHQVKAEYVFTTFNVPTSEGRKIALSPAQISLIASYQTEHPQESFYRDLFMFSFLGNGMNLSDIARLKFSNIADNEIRFVREKTKRKNRNAKTIQIPITGKMQSFIDKWGNKAVGFDSYIFDILKPSFSNEQNYAAIKQITKQVNKYINQVAKAVGIEEKISSYSARHSWSTISKNSGASSEYIKEQLGHSSVLVTENYLDSFEKSTRLEHSNTIEKTVYKAG